MNDDKHTQVTERDRDIALELFQKYFLNEDSTSTECIEAIAAELAGSRTPLRLPERKVHPTPITSKAGWFDEGWNACRAETERLNK